VSLLEDLNIQRISAGTGGVEGGAYSLYIRDNCVAMVAGTAGANRGSTGLMTEDRGLAYLVWREGQPYLAAKGGEIPATPEQVETLRKFSQDLDSALNTATGK
jgi:hypothetical protein